MREQIEESDSDALTAPNAALGIDDAALEAARRELEAEAVQRAQKWVEAKRLVQTYNDVVKNTLRRLAGSQPSAHTAMRAFEALATQTRLLSDAIDYMQQLERRGA